MSNHRAGWLPRWLWRPGSARGFEGDRLRNSITVYEVELTYLIERSQRRADNPDPDWPNSALTLLRRARESLDGGQVEAGWQCLLGCQRIAVAGLTDDEINVKAGMLEAEAREKLGSWRREGVEKALAGDLPRATVLAEALEIRDGHSSNQYLTIALIRKHMTYLAAILIVFFLSFLAVAFLLPRDSPWDDAIPLFGGVSARTVLSATLFGVVGAVFSAHLSTASAQTKSRIPERISSLPITLGRAVLGAPAAVMAILSLQVGLLPAGKNEPADSALILILAFAAGFSERLVVGALESIGQKPH